VLGLGNREVPGLGWNDIDLDAGTVVIDPQIQCVGAARDFKITTKLYTQVTDQQTSDGLKRLGESLASCSAVPFCVTRPLYRSSSIRHSRRAGHCGPAVSPCEPTGDDHG
jgi:hypothetical protein